VRQSNTGRSGAAAVTSSVRRSASRLARRRGIRWRSCRRWLRAAVIYRKLSLGSRSPRGERTNERLLSVDQTCRLQRRSLYAYLADVLAAKARGDPVPALS
jgi:hypothetical protein